MTGKTPRVPFVALATGLFLVLSFNSSPSVPSIPENLPAPDLQEVAALEELADWLTGEDEEALHAMSPADLTAAIREQPQTFELFRRYTDKESRRELLEQIPYGKTIFETAERHRLDSLLVAALVEVESSFAPTVVSPRGAVGLMQVLPSTARSFGVTNLKDPKMNIEAGTRYLQGLLRRFDGNLELALAAYNAGPGNVRRYGGVPPFRETRNYVQKVLSIYVDHHKNVWESAATAELLALR